MSYTDADTSLSIVDVFAIASHTDTKTELLYNYGVSLLHIKMQIQVLQLRRTQMRTVSPFDQREGRGRPLGAPPDRQGEAFDYLLAKASFCNYILLCKQKQIQRAWSKQRNTILTFLEQFIFLFA